VTKRTLKKLDKLRERRRSKRKELKVRFKPDLGFFSQDRESLYRHLWGRTLKPTRAERSLLKASRSRHGCHSVPSTTRKGRGAPVVEPPLSRSQAKKAVKRKEKERKDSKRAAEAARLEAQKFCRCREGPRLAKKRPDLGCLWCGKPVRG